MKATYKPGTQLTVGSHKVTIIKWLSEGGFAHVYTAKCTPPAPSGSVVCLKRVAVPTKALLNLLRAEVEAMQRLKGAANVVQYIDSHAERNKDESVGGYEVFVLMEFCAGGGLIDFMNTRLRDQLREHEVLKIMYDITLGLAAMHSLHPVLIHRDLKIENVLLTGDGDYKLCDFGSASPVLRAPKNPQELQILDDDIQHHTTAQYRSPEMLDLYRGFPIDEKSDIWALGVFLYKLCYYTTPFEQEGVPAILSASYIIPTKPAYSNRLKNCIRVLLQPNPQQRPTVFQVMSEVCSMRGVPNPLDSHHPIPPSEYHNTPPLPVQNAHAQPYLSDYSKSSDSRESLRQSGEYSRSPESYSYRSPEFPARTPPVRTPDIPSHTQTPDIQGLSLDAPAAKAVPVAKAVPQSIPQAAPKPTMPTTPGQNASTAVPSAQPVASAHLDIPATRPEEFSPVLSPSSPRSPLGEAFDQKFPPLSSFDERKFERSFAPEVPKPELHFSQARRVFEQDQQNHEPFTRKSMDLPRKSVDNSPFARKSFDIPHEPSKPLDQDEYRTKSFDQPRKSFDFSQAPSQPAQPVQAARKSSDPDFSFEADREPAAGELLRETAPHKPTNPYTKPRVYENQSQSQSQAQLQAPFDSTSAFERPKKPVLPKPQTQAPPTQQAAQHVVPPRASSPSPPPLPAKDESTGVSRARAIQERARAQVEAARFGAEAPERTKLKKILGGLEQRSNTVVLENDSHMVDSSLDFLRTLNREEAVHERSSSGSGHHHHHHIPHHLHLKPSRNSWLMRSGSRRRSREVEESDSDDHHFVGNTRFESEPSPDTMSPDPFGSVESSPSASMRGFKPTNSLQQRVHNLVSGSHPSPPAKPRHAKDLDVETDVDSTTSSPIAHSKSTPSLNDIPKKPTIQKRPKPMLHAATGPQKPPKPPKA